MNEENCALTEEWQVQEQQHQFQLDSAAAIERAALEKMALQEQQQHTIGVCSTEKESAEAEAPGVAVEMWSKIMSKMAAEAPGLALGSRGTTDGSKGTRGTRDGSRSKGRTSG